MLKALAGETLDLNCVAEGSPEPRLSWSKDGAALPGGVPEGSVHFAAVQTSDAGLYRCEAASSAGTDAWELELRVLGECPSPMCLASPARHRLDLRGALSLPSGDRALGLSGTSQPLQRWHRPASWGLHQCLGTAALTASCTEAPGPWLGSTGPAVPHAHWKT